MAIYSNFEPSGSLKHSLKLANTRGARLSRVSEVNYAPDERMSQNPSRVGRSRTLHEEQLLQLIKSSASNVADVNRRILPPRLRTFIDGAITVPS